MIKWILNLPLQKAAVFFLLLVLIFLLILTFVF